MAKYGVVYLLIWLAASSPATESPVRINSPVADARIVVHKAQRQLVLYSNGKPLRRFAIGLGFKPSGQKQGPVSLGAAAVNVEDADMRELFTAVRAGTPVSIRP